jgi:glycosyltransferase involved in cell wall biosynthesis
MRVLIALNTYEQDGPGQLVFRLCQRLVSVEGLQLNTVALSRAGPLMDRFRELGIGTEFVPTRGREGLARLRAWAGHLARRADRPDVIHTNLLWPDLALRLVAGRLRGIPLASTCHGLHALEEKGLFPGLIYRVLDRVTRGRCDAWVAISHFVRDGLLAHGIPARRIHLIPNGIDCVQTHPLPEPRRAEIRDLLNVAPDAPLIVAAGTLREIKGHDVLLEAMPAILERFPDTHLFVFGEGPLGEDYRRRTEAMGLAGQVKFIGLLSTMLAQVMATADVVVHPSRVEAFGLVAGEAQACGTPVIASRVGGLPELVRDGETGFLVDPGRPDQIAERVCLLLGDAERRRAMGAAAREFINEHFEIGVMAEAYLELWKGLCGRDPEADAEAIEREEQGRAIPSSDFQLKG